MKRLTMLSLIATVAGCGDGAPGKTYVLVHGAWLSADGWAPVAERLEERGATVRTLDLPAHGDDPTPASAATLASYVERVGTEIEAAETPVILVGHSLGGAVITQAAEQYAADLDGMVYIAAYVPKTGQSVLDLAMMDGGSDIPPYLQFNADGTVGIEQTAFPDLFCADCDADARATLIAGYRVEPGMPMGTPVTIGDAYASVRKTYFRTARDRVLSPALQALMLDATPMAREVTFESSHLPLLSQPEAIAEALLAE